MPNMDDFHAFQSTSGGDGGGGAGSGGCLTWLLVILGVLWGIGKLVG